MMIVEMCKVIEVVFRAGVFLQRFYAKIKCRRLIKVLNTNEEKGEVVVVVLV